MTAAFSRYFFKRVRERSATENAFKDSRVLEYAPSLLAIPSGGDFAPSPEYDILANLTLDLYCCSLISVT